MLSPERDQLPVANRYDTTKGVDAVFYRYNVVHSTMWLRRIICTQTFGANFPFTVMQKVPYSRVVNHIRTIIVCGIDFASDYSIYNNKTGPTVLLSEGNFTVLPSLNNADTVYLFVCPGT